ncbi:MAG: cytochrome c [Alphaproteobacteria bacterium]|nr:MAG: cytochrome c [Alphaproteobacteria bacterium]
MAALLPGGAPGAARAADVFAGAKIYEEHCARCHGPRGVPVLPNVPDFSRGERLDAPDQVLIERTRAGGRLMPSFDRIISDRDILDVVAFIRTLQR